jgi:hypothetical protein
LLEHFNLLTGTVDTRNLTDMTPINNQNTDRGLSSELYRTMLQHSRDSKRFLNMIKNNITAANYYKQGTTNQTNQPTNQTINQPNEIQIYNRNYVFTAYHLML